MKQPELIESYCPPGADISSACGQFAAKYYRSGDAP